MPRTGEPAIALSASAAEQMAKIAEADRIERDRLVDEQIVAIPGHVSELGANAPCTERPTGLHFWEQIQFRDPIPYHVHAPSPAENCRLRSGRPRDDVNFVPEQPLENDNPCIVFRYYRLTIRRDSVISFVSKTHQGDR